MTGQPEGGLATQVSLGYDQIQRLALAAESLAEDEAEFDPEFAAALRADATRLQRQASAGTVTMDDEADRPVTVGFSAALDD